MVFLPQSSLVFQFQPSVTRCNPEQPETCPFIAAFTIQILPHLNIICFHGYACPLREVLNSFMAVLISVI